LAEEINMARQAYIPPKQGTAGIIFDSLLMLVLVFCALKAPTWIAEWRAAQEAAVEEAAASEEAAPVVTWEQLGQNAAMQEGWEKLGKDPAAAKAIIDNKFDYSFDGVKLVSVAALLVFYFWYMLSVSAKQYSGVIDERFGGSASSTDAAAGRQLRNNAR
jgi:hypothetical protein